MGTYKIPGVRDGEDTQGTLTVSVDADGDLRAEFEPDPPIEEQAAVVEGNAVHADPVEEPEPEEEDARDPDG